MKDRSAATARFRILKQVSSDRLAAAVPPRFHDVSPSCARNELLTVILFADVNERQVVWSGRARRAVDELDDFSERVVALADAFTDEAECELDAYSIEAIGIEGDRWCDDEWLNLHKESS